MIKILYFQQDLARVKALPYAIRIILTVEKRKAKDLAGNGNKVVV